MPVRQVVVAFFGVMVLLASGSAAANGQEGLGSECARQAENNGSGE